MMDVGRIVSAAIPNADNRMVDFIMWSRTPYPCGNLTAKTIYKSARRFYRASVNGNRLCELCDNIASKDKSICVDCTERIRQLKDE